MYTDEETQVKFINEIYDSEVFMGLYLLINLPELKYLWYWKKLHFTDK